MFLKFTEKHTCRRLYLNTAADLRSATLFQKLFQCRYLLFKDISGKFHEVFTQTITKQMLISKSRNLQPPGLSTAALRQYVKKTLFFIYLAELIWLCSFLLLILVQN